MSNKYLFTSESVTEGHPDKIADQISDAILDAVYEKDLNGRVACETLVTTGLVFVAGEITTGCYVDIPNVMRKTIKDIGYTVPDFGFDYKNCGVITSIQEQSGDIAQGVDKGGAGDQGCIKEGSLIRTSEGFLPIQEVKKGDLVITPYGTKRVLNTKMTGVKNIVELKFANGMQLECTPKHKVLCYKKNGTTYWKEASKLDDKDFICTLKPSQLYSSKNKLSKIKREEFFTHEPESPQLQLGDEWLSLQGSASRNPERKKATDFSPQGSTKYNHKIYGPEKVVLDEEMAYIIGLLIGDGCATDEKCVRISFGKNKTEALKVKKILDKKFPEQWKMCAKKDGSIELKIDSILVRSHLEKFGVKYNKSPQKMTPRAIFVSPKKIIKSYLRGLFDTDGTIVSNTGRKKKNIRIRLGSSSNRLLKETQLLLNEFRIKSSILSNSYKGTPVVKDKRYKSNYGSYVLSLKGFESYQNFGKKVGFSNFSKKKRLVQYLNKTYVKPKNSPSIFLVPHSRKEEMVGEEYIGKKLPFSVTKLKKRVEKQKAKVYDLEIEEINIFSANGIFVHNSMFGYATDETEELMPLPITLAHKLVKELANIRKKGVVDYLRPDGKSQVTVEYHDRKPSKAKAVVLSAHHSAEVKMDKVKNDLKELVIDEIIPEEIRTDDFRIFINPTGRFVTGGPTADTGVTGRKVIVDTYGGVGSHGGGCFCISGSSYINTDKGLQQIKDMKDNVEKGLIAKTDIHPHRIGDWYDNGLKETIEITTDNGYTIKGTPNHRIRVMDKEGQYVWRRLDSLKDEDYIAIHKKERLFGNEVMLDDFSYTYKEGTAESRKNKFVYPDVLTEGYAYLLGLLVGDGNCMIEGAIAICVCEKEQKENVQNLYQKLFGRKGKIFGNWAYMGGVELRAYLQHMGLECRRSWEKQVPWCIFKASKECMGAFLRGLFDTDGGIRINGRNNNFLDIKFTSSSLLLIKEVQQLLLNFGIVSRINCVDKTGVSFVIGKKKRKTVTCRPQYSLRVKDVEGVKRFKKYIGFGLHRKQKILDKIRLDEKRTYLILPHQRKRIMRLWDKLNPKEHQKDISNIGRFTRSIASNKATKNLTYAKLKEFLCAYKERLGDDKDFQYLEFLYNLNHFYDKVKEKKNYTSVSTYDLYVPESNTFIANGFVCHNSGKDPTKVDRSASYYTRYIAKNIVAAGLAKKCEVQLAYAIGVKEPVSILVNTFGTGKLKESKIKEIIRENFKLTPRGMIKELKLLRPIYKKTACYGHFGREDPDFYWERLDKKEKLEEYL